MNTFFKISECYGWNGSESLQLIVRLLLATLYRFSVVLRVSIVRVNLLYSNYQNLLFLPVV
jgi:hypothetical protein